MSIARQHAEWLNLIDISGPFLTLDVLVRVFPQGLDVIDSDLRRELRLVYAEWQAERNDPAIHQRWMGYVMDTVLAHPEAVLATGQAIPASLFYRSREYGEIRPQMVLHAPDTPADVRLLVMTYPPEQALERQVPHSGSSASPATRMMELLHATGVPLGLVTNGEQWMLVHATAGETTSFVSWYAELWLTERVTLQAFVSLLGVYRFFGVDEGSTLAALMLESADAQHEVTDQLGYQVRQAVEILVRAIDRIDHGRNRDLLVGVDEAQLYEAALTVMMRLVFLMSAEERGLLLLGDGLYDQYYAVTTLRAQLREAADQFGEEVLERRFDAWSRLLAIFRAVHGGVEHEALRLPAYGGSLFDPDRFPFLEGRPSGSHWRTATAVPLTIDNRTTLHLLEALQILRVKVPGGGMAEARRLSFRALSVTQIGHVYEGLLDHEARRAEGVILGLTGTKKSEPEIPLAELESQTSPKALQTYIKKATGRSLSPIKKALEAAPDPERARRLRAVCGGDEALYGRVLPFLNVIRDDDRGMPYMVLDGGIYVTGGTARRATGTHYTPESLTRPIVQHTLEPLVYRGSAEGWDAADWQLKPAAELLSLKVCDMAMGSGAFLVAVVEYLAERLVEAWDGIAQSVGGEGIRLQITPEGLPATGALGEMVIPMDDPDERLRLAKRLVADRCIYGVDKNPLAVEMAKLSLWLVTLSKGRAFTFLDHALKAGDSLVGVNLEQLRFWNLQATGENVMQPTHTRRLVAAIEDVKVLRQQLESFTVNDIRDQEEKARLLAEAEARAHDVRGAADLLVATYMNDLKAGDQDALRQVTLEAVQAGGDIPEDVWPHLDMNGLTPFHWELEFPEVFGRGGFDAFVGNPPFIGGQKITGLAGVPYRNYLIDGLANGQKGSADICAYFFLRGAGNLRQRGAFGWIATNTIAQGATREVGLDQLTQNGVTLYRATNNQAWPGAAAVVVSVVHGLRGGYKGGLTLDDETVPYISPLLDSMPNIGNPYRLAANAGKSFQGSIVLGMGFVLAPDEAQALIDQDPRNAEVLFPYLNGQDLNSHPEQQPSRWVINFFDWSEAQAQQYPDCYAIVKEKVKPARDAQKRAIRKKYWWRFAERAPALYEAIAPLRRVLVVAQTSNTLGFSFAPKEIVYSNATIVIAFDLTSALATLQSTHHKLWVLQHASSLKGDARYIPRDCFQTFPFPDDMSRLEGIGERYHETRRGIMLNRQEGLTDTYNRFHDPDESASDIVGLRALHVEMDEVVAAAYGWDDIALGHGFHETAQGVRYTISEAARRDVLTRLLKLNHERYAQECREKLHKQKDCAAFFAEHPEHPRALDVPSVGGRKVVPDYDDYAEQGHLFDDDETGQKRLF